MDKIFHLSLPTCPPSLKTSWPPLLSTLGLVQLFYPLKLVSDIATTFPCWPGRQLERHPSMPLIISYVKIRRVISIWGLITLTIPLSRAPLPNYWNYRAWMWMVLGSSVNSAHVYPSMAVHLKVDCNNSVIHLAILVQMVHFWLPQGTEWCLVEIRFFSLSHKKKERT